MTVEFCIEATPNEIEIVAKSNTLKKMSITDFKRILECNSYEISLKADEGVAIYYNLQDLLKFNEPEAYKKLYCQRGDAK